MTEVFGRPIAGDIPNYNANELPDQKPDIEFLELLDAVLGQPGVESVKWNQYTPYFNDGDACTFGVGEMYVKLVGIDEEVGDYDDGYLSSFDLGYEGYATELAKARTGTDLKAIQAAMRELDNTAYFEIFLRKTFGDPSKVVATKEGFDVEFCEHD